MGTEGLPYTAEQQVAVDAAKARFNRRALTLGRGAAVAGAFAVIAGAQVGWFANGARHFTASQAMGSAEFIGFVALPVVFLLFAPRRIWALKLGGWLAVAPIVAAV